MSEFEDDDERFKGTEYSMRFLCHGSVIKDVMTFAFNGIVSIISDDPISSSSDTVDGQTRSRQPNEYPDYYDRDDGINDSEEGHSKPNGVLGNIQEGNVSY